MNVQKFDVKNNLLRVRGEDRDVERISHTNWKNVSLELNIYLFPSIK